MPGMRGIWYQNLELCVLVQVREALSGLKLDNAAVWRKERQRQKLPEHPKAPWFIQWPYLSICWIMDVIYDKRPIQRFWFLETVARMPYFAYISMLHLYESLGWWRAGAELRRVRFCSHLDSATSSSTRCSAAIPKATPLSSWVEGFGLLPYLCA